MVGVGMYSIASVRNKSCVKQMNRSTEKKLDIGIQKGALVGEGFAGPHRSPRKVKTGLGAGAPHPQSSCSRDFNLPPSPPSPFPPCAVSATCSQRRHVCPDSHLKTYFNLSINTHTQPVDSLLCDPV